MTLSKTQLFKKGSCSEEIDAPKEYYCVEVVKEVRRSSFS